MRDLIERLAARFVPCRRAEFPQRQRSRRSSHESRVAVKLERSIAAFARARTRHRRRRELAGARARRGRLVAGLHEERLGRDAPRSRRSRVPRLRDVVGRAAPRPRASRGTRAVTNAAARGTSFGTPTETESELAELIVSMMPSIERLRFVSSGTEATMSRGASRARLHAAAPSSSSSPAATTATATAFLIAAGSGALTHGVPELAGRNRERRARYDRAAVQRRRGRRTGV